MSICFLHYCNIGASLLPNLVKNCPFGIDKFHFNRNIDDQIKKITLQTLQSNSYFHEQSVLPSCIQIWLLSIIPSLPVCSIISRLILNFLIIQRLAKRQRNYELAQQRKARLVKGLVEDAIQEELGSQ